jgi:hypothetical protein
LGDTFSDDVTLGPFAAEQGHSLLWLVTDYHKPHKP